MIVAVVLFPVLVHSIFLSRSEETLYLFRAHAMKYRGNTLFLPCARYDIVSECLVSHVHTLISRGNTFNNPCTRYIRRSLTLIKYSTPWQLRGSALMRRQNYFIFGLVLRLHGTQLTGRKAQKSEFGLQPGKKSTLSDMS